MAKKDLPNYDLIMNYCNDVISGKVLVNKYRKKGVERFFKRS